MLDLHAKELSSLILGVTWEMWKIEDNYEVGVGNSSNGMQELAHTELKEEMAKLKNFSSGHMWNSMGDVLREEVRDTDSGLEKESWGRQSERMPTEAEGVNETTKEGA